MASHDPGRIRGGDVLHLTDPLGSLAAIQAALPGRLRVRPMIPGDADAFASQATPADDAAMTARGFVSVIDAARQAHARPGDHLVFTADDAVGALAGCIGADEAPDVASPYFFTVAPVFASDTALMPAARACISRWRLRWPMLVAWSWHGNEEHQRFLRSLGFAQMVGVVGDIVPGLAAFTLRSAAA